MLLSISTLNLLRKGINVPFVITPNHEVTLVAGTDGVEIHVSGQKIGTLLNSAAKLQLAVVADPVAAGVSVEPSGPSVGKIQVV